jgi:outer membrane murein-binding lipoprotein Lpp
LQHYDKEKEECIKSHKTEREEQSEARLTEELMDKEVTFFGVDNTKQIDSIAEKIEDLNEKIEQLMKEKAEPQRRKGSNTFKFDVDNENIQSLHAGGIGTDYDFPGEKIDKLTAKISDLQSSLASTQEKLPLVQSQIENAVELITQKVYSMASTGAQTPENMIPILKKEIWDLFDQVSPKKSRKDFQENSLEFKRVGDLEQEIKNREYFDLTEILFKTGSLLVNLVAHLIQTHPNYYMMRKEIIG